MSKKKDRINFLREEYIGRNIEEGKKKIYDISRKKDKVVVSFDKVTVEDFEQILNADPTFNKQYSQWLLNIFVNGNLLIEDLYKANQDLSTLYKFKSRISPEKRDVNRFVELEELYQVVKEISSLPEEELLSNTQLSKIVKAEGIEVFLDTKRWFVLSPMTKEASCIYGANTRWCTASKVNSYFESYNKEGKLYIVIDKMAPKEEKTKHKYQFHFERRHFMDADDHSIDHFELLRENPELRDCFLGLKDGNGLGLKLRFGIGLTEEDKKIIIADGKKIDWLREFQGEELPEGLHITGNLDLSNCKAKIIKNLTVIGDLNIKKSSLQSLVGKIHITGTLNAEGSELTEVPKDLFVGGSLFLRATKITNISNLTVEGNMYASGLDLRQVPDNLKVGGSLYLHGCKFGRDELKNVQVGERLWIDRKQLIS